MRGAILFFPLVFFLVFWDDDVSVRPVFGLFFASFFFRGKGLLVLFVASLCVFTLYVSVLDLPHFVNDVSVCFILGGDAVRPAFFRLVLFFFGGGGGGILMYISG